MTSFSVATFPVEAGRCVVDRLDEFHPRPLRVFDAAVVDWPGGDARPVTWQVRPVDDRRALAGAFWGHLFSRLILLPLSQVDEANRFVVGGRDLVDTSLSHLGLDPRSLDAVRDAIGPATVTVFLLHDGSQQTAIADVFAGGHVFAARVELSLMEERRLYAGFGARGLPDSVLPA